MSRRILLLCLLVVPLATRAQKFAFEYWHEGKIVLESGDTLHGQLKYNVQEDLVQLQSSNRVETYTSRKIVFYEIFDLTVKRYRQFYSLPYATTGQYRVPIFFELLAEGNMTLLAREALELKTFSAYSYYSSYSRLVLVNKYFLMKGDGTINPFTGKKSDLLEMMGAKEDQVAKYIKENKLDFDDKYDVARMVTYYNSLFR